MMWNRAICVGILAALFLGAEAASPGRGRGLFKKPRPDTPLSMRSGKGLDVYAGQLFAEMKEYHRCLKKVLDITKRKKDIKGRKLGVGKLLDFLLMEINATRALKKLRKSSRPEGFPEELRKLYLWKNTELIRSMGKKRARMAKMILKVMIAKLNPGEDNTSSDPPLANMVFLEAEEASRPKIIIRLLNMRKRNPAMPLFTLSGKDLEVYVRKLFAKIGEYLMCLKKVQDITRRKKDIISKKFTGLKRISKKLVIMKFDVDKLLDVISREIHVVEALEMLRKSSRPEEFPEELREICRGENDRFVALMGRKKARIAKAILKAIAKPSLDEGNISNDLLPSGMEGESEARSTSSYLSEESYGKQVPSSTQGGAGLKRTESYSNLSAFGGELYDVVNADPLNPFL